MKIFEKVKNMFTEEVEEEVKIEQVPSKAKNDKIPKVVDSFEDIKIEKEELKKPVFFTDHDFEDLKQEQNKKLEREPKTRSDIDTRSSLYNSYNDSEKKYGDKKEYYRGNQTADYNDPYNPYKEKKEERVFKPTPIISPVYGILDKNYHKEDIVSKKDVRSSSNESDRSIDSIRKKAYGTLEDELENTLFGSNSILFNKKEEEMPNNDDFFGELENETKPDLLNNMEYSNNIDEHEQKIKDLEEITMDIGKELNSLLNKKETSQSVRKDEEDDDLFNLIDTMYEGDE